MDISSGPREVYQASSLRRGRIGALFRFELQSASQKQSNGGSQGIVMEAISRGPVGLLYFTVQRDDFANLHPHPPYQYFLVTQVFTPDGEYICTQLLGIDLRAVRYLEAQGCERRTADKLTAADRERIQACLDQYARFVVTKATDAVLGHVVGTGQKIQ